LCGDEISELKKELPKKGEEKNPGRSRGRGSELSL
jgi:hypothetical protein